MQWILEINYYYGSEQVYIYCFTIVLFTCVISYKNQIDKITGIIHVYMQLEFYIELADEVQRCDDTYF